MGTIATPKFASSLRPSLLPEIALFCPTDLDEVFEHLRQGASLLAGGTDILLMATQRGEPNYFVWTGEIEALKAFDPDPETIRVGAATTLAQVIGSSSLRTGAPAVSDGARIVGSVQIRNQATLVGNVCSASPAADTIPGLSVHDCMVEIVNLSHEKRQVRLGDFLTGPGKTSLGDDELVSGLSFSRLKLNQFSAFQRFTHRKALDLAFASVAVRLEYEADQQSFKSVILALGAVGPTVVDASKAANIMIGNTLSDGLITKVADAACQLCAPISDHRASAEYRLHLIRTLIGDVIKQAADRAGGKE